MFKFLRLASLLAYLVYGFVMIMVFWPLMGAQSRLRLEQRYAAGLLRILKVKVTARFESNESRYAENGPMLIYSNHVSWLDIFAFNAVHPVTFIAKSEISQWPIAGVLAKRSGTLFIERGKRHAVRDVIAAAVKRIHTGRTVAVFPEGTTGPGDSPLHFHSNFAQPAIQANVKLLPVSLQYFDAKGVFTAAPAFIGEQTLLQNIQVLVGTRDGFEVRLTFHAPLDAQGISRHELSDKAREQITRHCEQAASGQRN